MVVLRPAGLVDGQLATLLGSLSGGAFGTTSFSNSAPNLLTIAGAIGARDACRSA